MNRIDTIKSIHGLYSQPSKAGKQKELTIDEKINKIKDKIKESKNLILEYDDKINNYDEEIKKLTKTSNLKIKFNELEDDIDSIENEKKEILKKINIMDTDFSSDKEVDMDLYKQLVNDFNSLEDERKELDKEYDIIIKEHNELLKSTPKEKNKIIVKLKKNKLEAVNERFKIEKEITKLKELKKELDVDRLIGTITVFKERVDVLHINKQGETKHAEGITGKSLKEFEEEAGLEALYKHVLAYPLDDMGTLKKAALESINKNLKKALLNSEMNSISKIKNLEKSIDKFRMLFLQIPLNKENASAIKNLIKELTEIVYIFESISKTQPSSKDIEDNKFEIQSFTDSLEALKKQDENFSRKLILKVAKHNKNPLLAKLPELKEQNPKSVLRHKD